MPAAWVTTAVEVYSALNSSSGGGGNSSDTQRNMQAADPFASQRWQYQNALAKLMGMQPTATSYGSTGSIPSWMQPVSSVGASGMTQTQIDAARAGAAGSAPRASGGGGGALGMWLGSGPGPGAASGGSAGAPSGYTPSDPSYDFRLKSGAEAIQRAMGAKGMNGSGNMMAALMQYGQNLGSTEYQNDFNRLAILSGAESGSPGAAGQLGFQGQQAQASTDAATLAQWNQWLTPAAKAVGGWLNSGGGGGAAGGGSSSGGTGSGDNSYSDPFADNSYTT